MMRTTLVFLLCVMATIFGIIRTSLASLIEINNEFGHVVYDNQANVYWYWNLASFTNQTYNQQIENIEKLNLGNGYYGINTWYMATQNEMDVFRLNSLLSIGQAFASTGFHPQCPEGENCSEWIGRYNRLYEQGDGTDHYLYAVAIPPWDTSIYIENAHGVSDLNPYNNVGAWITSIEDPIGTPIPEPDTAVLLITGLVGIIYCAWRPYWGFHC